MDRQTRGPRGWPVILLEVRLLRVSRVGRRTIEVIADVHYRDCAQGPVRRRSVFVSGDVPVPTSGNRPDLRQLVLTRIMQEFGRARAVEGRTFGQQRDHS